MTQNRTTRRIAIAALTAATMIGVAACGDDDSSSTTAAGGKATSAGQLTKDCSMVLGPVTTMAGGVGIFNVSGQDDDLLIDEAQFKLPSTYAPIVKDSELKSLLIESGTNNEQFNAAVKAGDTKKRDEIFADQAGIWQTVQDKCKSDWDPTLGDAVKLYGKNFADGITGKKPVVTSKRTAAPLPEETETTTKAPEPVKLTAPGTSVGFGQSVTLTYTDEDDKSGSYIMTVGKPEKAKDSDIKKFDEDTRKRFEQLYYIRATVNPTSQTSADPINEPDLANLRARYEITTSDGSPAVSMTALGNFEPCKSESNDKDGRDVCSLITLTSKSATITEVKLTELRDDELDFTWK